MASKRKKNLNEHQKGFIKNQNAYYNRVHAKQGCGKVRGGGFSYVALDTNIIFRMIDMLEGREIFNQQEYLNLRRLLQCSCYKENGEVNKRGKFVLCVLPSVFKELSDRKGRMHTLVQDFVENRMLVIKICDGYKEEFENKVQQLLKAYKENNLFVDEHGRVKMDGRIEAEAAIMNFDLATQDHHFQVYNNHSGGRNETRFELLNKINKKCLEGDHGGKQGQPQTLKTFFECYNKGLPVARPENERYLDEETLECIKVLKFVSPKPALFANKNPEFVK